MQGSDDEKVHRAGSRNYIILGGPTIMVLLIRKFMPSNNPRNAKGYLALRTSVSDPGAVQKKNATSFESQFSFLQY